MKSIILGGGCFWCIQAALEQIKGIIHTEAAYSGGKINPTYESVCKGDGNIEVVKLSYDQNQISLIEILTLFFKIHDPTSQDKQGADVGIQYRSVIFYENEEDKQVINNFIKEQQKTFDKPILTQVCKLTTYSKAEDYHQHYFIKNPHQGYCQSVIAPKIAKIRQN
ncbi:peptide-methionine (S)-S-oxide reductase MsrA [Campylobacter sp. VicNov18]|uniref:peptide-methionine (S)-S-oxide reductase MsrA n=1 Tax=Campylobacter bilis TaxID=2691918 RepID=UPI00130D9AD1|nr:peptide-methionine (S)-S-oxide reductase MsrA [Campylobacter bilis]MPV63434.1 peptide-methionine (S)-S-oxide reductase MsrA [Campylobacter hepaticus]MBM0636933.1 peptide-methionine (S)-S-oxide reductase MsrA [Campylobacter bilis]MCC8277645.1 peptide-methionine (S)-S-oxide reductase MsrA [Campylobacter bilis]MCC8299254.1 peptide-methionine (S)-S-oxide reductase MsrA [Campylobacter bilis]MCC8300554.1 peptide-methionine (S)-S-oxide reductase MsrA [Campylobacter bilis]